MKTLTRFSVQYPVTIIMLIFAVLLLGYISFSKLGVDLFPDLNNPRIFVEIKAGERPPEEIEQQFVQNIESIAIRQKKVTQVSSISRVGVAQVTVEYTWDADMDEAFLDLQKALTTFTQNSEIDELNISQHDPNAVPVMTLALSNEKFDDMADLRKVAENYLRNELVRLDGIAEVELLGSEEKEVVVETDPYLMQAFNLSPSEIAQKINSYNRNVSGGSIVEMGRKYVVKGVSEITEVDDIGSIIVTYHQVLDLAGEAIPGQRTPVFLRDVADVRYNNKEPENIVHVDQQRCMALAIYKETKYNTVKAVEVLFDNLKDLQKALPGYELVVIQNQGEFITTAIDEVKQTALIGITLAIIILFVFLRRFGTTLIISFAIPISIVATFNLMYFNGLTLNIMTLGGLALGAGMLVDNAIVVMENIFRNMEAGKSIKEAAIDGAAQVGGAITASTVTTIVVFLPIVYLHGSAGELFKDQAWTVAFALLSSLVVAVLVIPMLSSKILKTSTTIKNVPVRFTWYKKSLTNILKRPWTVIIVSAGLILLSVLLLPIIGSEFIPKTDSNELRIAVKLSEGTELHRTDTTIRDIETTIRSLLGEQISNIYSTVGPTSSTSESDDLFEDENTANINLILKQDRSMNSEEIIEVLNKNLTVMPDAEFQYVSGESALQMTLGTDEAPIVVQVRGEDLDVIQELSDQVKEKMLVMQDLFNVETSFDQGRTEINIVLDRVRAGILNVGIESVASALQNHLSGAEAGEWETGGELQDITLRLPDISVNQLSDIEISSGTQKIRLDDVADIEFSTAPKEINRRNQTRVGFITAHLKTDRPFDAVVKDLRSELSSISMPTDYRLDITGEEQKRQEAFASLGFALLLSIVLVYMVMASQFESLVHPFTILLSIPLAMTGVVFIFLLVGKSFDIMALIGVIMLAGIAVNDSIILVDAINQLKRDGAAVRDAIIEAGMRRIRPIIMTSLTTILALLPLTFGFGEGAALRQPMALAVIGGLVTSTLLTLVVIPCVYLKLDKLAKQ
jgi:hydrophobic/amphiphilic exporter-1 (mainly G- bacteria), HAE1 family